MEMNVSRFSWDEHQGERDEEYLRLREEKREK